MKSPGQPPRVLIVEDEAIIGLDLKRLLSSSGYGVAAVAASSDQALRAIESTSPDLVLMDIHLKGPVDGIETALQIRKNFGLPFVFVTAHADKATLERARQSQPFGYIVKPVSPLSLTSTIEMALHKHRIERQLEDHRAWLTTLLRSIPDSVCVTDLAGDVQFLNDAAENLLSMLQADAVGKSVDSVLSLVSGEQTNLASELLDKAEWGNRVSFPKETFLRFSPSNTSVPVEGSAVISYSGDQPAGAVFILRDVSRRDQEESILRQEERILALGHLASSVARDFSSLHNLLDTTCNELVAVAHTLRGPERAAVLDKADTISRVGAMGLLMTEQLMQLNAPPFVRATLVNASGVVASVEPLLNKLRSPTLQVDIHLTDESTLILCHPDRLQTLLVNVFLNACERMAGSGRIRVSTAQAGSRVLILFEIEHIGASAWKSLASPLEMENPDFSLSIAQAIVTAMEGSIAYVPLSDTQGRLEIQLPLQRASQDLVDAVNRRGTALLTGSDLEILTQIEDRFEAKRYAVIRCPSAAEALLMGQLYDGKIDFVVADVSSVTAASRRQLRSFFSSRNAETKFIRLVSEKQAEEPGWHSLAKSPQAHAAERLTYLLGIDERSMKA